MVKICTMQMPNARVLLLVVILTLAAPVSPQCKSN